MNRFTALTGALLVTSVAALAGPPMVCHPYTIGKDASLPWVTDANSWNTPDPGYDLANLTADTLRILDSSRPVLTRMETLRRAAVYSMKSPAAGSELAARLTSRALSAELKGQTDGFALFDAGFFAETMKQMARITKSHTFDSFEGYDWVRRSLPSISDKPTLLFALGLMEAEYSWPNENMRQAAVSAPEGSLLAENIRKHFSKQKLEELKHSPVLKSAVR